MLHFFINCSKSTQYWDWCLMIKYSLIIYINRYSLYSIQFVISPFISFSNIKILSCGYFIPSFKTVCIFDLFVILVTYYLQRSVRKSLLVILCCIILIYSIGCGFPQCTYVLYKYFNSIVHVHEEFGKVCVCETNLHWHLFWCSMLIAIYTRFLSVSLV